MSALLRKRGDGRASGAVDTREAPWARTAGARETSSARARAVGIREASAFGAAGLVLAPDERIHYAYGTLTGARRRAYEAICDAAAAGCPRATVRGLASSAEAFEVVRMVRADHPEIHWLGSGAQIAAAPGYAEVHLARCDDARPGDDAALLAAADAFARALPQSADEYLVAKAAFEQVARSTRYDHAVAGRSVSHEPPSMRPYEATGALVDRLAVCAGFAKATQLLLQRCGIMAVLLSGEARSASGSGDGWGAHAWLAVRINERFCHMDPTWASMGRDEAGLPAEVRYDYFGLTDREIAPTHRATSCPFEPPVCDSSMAEYYRREGLCLHAWNEARYTDMVCRQLAAGQASASVKAANGPTYRKMVDRIVHGGGWRAALLRAGATTGRELSLDAVRFSTDEALRTLTVWASATP